MKLKDSSVNPDLNPVFWEPLFAIDAFWRDAVGYELVITSAKDGRHKDYSKHYAGCAIDMRTWNKERSGRQLHGTRRQAMRDMVAGLMGDDFQVIDEPNHFHIEYEPRTL